MSLPNMDLKGVTQEDVSKLTKAMKSKEFRSHMDEYCKEVSDPGNRKEYLQYLDQLEAKGEMPDGQQLLRCQPGCCVKTWISFKNGQTQKCFINIVHTDRLEDVSMERSDKGEGHKVQLPYSLSPPRPDRDHKDEYCLTCDFAVSSRTFYQAMQYPNYLKMLVDTASDNLASHHLKGNEEVKKDYKVMQKMACKGGFPMPMSVKAEMLKDRGTKPTTPKVKPGAADAVTPSELRQMRKEAKQTMNHQEPQEKQQATPAQVRTQEQAAPAAPRIRVPVHRLVHSGTFELADFMESDYQASAKQTSIPKLLRLTVEVPTVKKVADISLEVTSMNVVVEVPEKYYLDLPLPYEIQEERGTAKFDKTKQVLTLELPVVPKPQTLNPNCYHDQGDGPAGGEGNDGALSEGNSDSDELPALQEEAEEDEAKPNQGGERLDPTSAACPEPPAAAGPQEHARPLLELGEQGGPLNFARHEAEEEEAEESVQAAGQEDLPTFIACEGFEGSRPGYFFGLGTQGLGYHLDRRQPRPGNAGRRKVKTSADVLLPGAAVKGAESPAPAPAEPLVTEVATAPSTAVGKAHTSPAAGQGSAPLEPQRQLPVHIQKYLESTSTLAARTSSSSAATVASEEPHVRWEQNFQNIMLFIDVPVEHQVSDLQLTLRGQRLLLAFCSCPSSSMDTPCIRWQVRRLLCGMVDIRQWHAQPPLAGSPLVVVLRKVDRGIWPEIWDAKAPVPSEVPETSRDTESAVPALTSATSGSIERTKHTGVIDMPKQGFDMNATAEEVPIEDSAELDVLAEPADEASSTARAVAEQTGGRRGAATEATIQSAVVMGQGVLIRNRMIYELL